MLKPSEFKRKQMIVMVTDHQVRRLYKLIQTEMNCGTAAAKEATAFLTHINFLRILPFFETEVS